MPPVTVLAVQSAEVRVTYADGRVQDYRRAKVGVNRDGTAVIRVQSRKVETALDAEVVPDGTGRWVVRLTDGGSWLVKAAKPCGCGGPR